MAVAWLDYPELRPIEHEDWPWTKTSVDVEEHCHGWKGGSVEELKWDQSREAHSLYAEALSEVEVSQLMIDQVLHPCHLSC